MKTASLLPVALVGLLAVAVTLPQNARAQNDTGGPGTIDPNTVALHELIRDSSIVRDPNEVVDARLLATDAAGNIYTAAKATRTDTVYRTFHCIISKYAPDGTLRWQRERVVASRPGGGEQETFSPDQTPVAITDQDAVSLADVGVLTVDAAGNVAAGFNTLIADPNPPNNRPRLIYAPRTLIVRFDTNGRFLWRNVVASDSGGPNILPYYHDYERSGLTALELTANGGVTALLSNSPSSNSFVKDHGATVLVNYAPDGTRKFAAVYGTGPDGLNSAPTALALDGAGSAYVLTTESTYDPTTGAVGETITNVIRKFDPAGNVVARADAPSVDSANGMATEERVQARIDTTGNLYIAGNFFRPSSAGNDGQAGQLVRSYHPDLTLRWRALGPQPAKAQEDQPFVRVVALRLSPGGVTVGGRTQSEALLGASGDEHWEVTRFAYADGAIQWHRLYQAPAVPNVSRADFPTNLQVDAQDNVYGVGLRSASPRNELVLIKYSAIGDTQFIKVLPDLDTNTNSFQLIGGNRPALISPVPTLNGKAFVVETVDNPAVVAAPPASAHPAFFNGEVSLGNGIYYLAFIGTGNVFGYYAYLSDPHFVFHFDMGYLYWFDSGDGTGGIYFYDFTSDSFFYTSPSFGFPYLYDFKLSAFLYYFPDANNPGRYTQNPRYFYNFATGQVISK